MLKILISVLIIFGFSFTLWSLVGLMRFIFELLARKKKPSAIINDSYNYQHQVAVCMAAYNEELVIADSLHALKKIISPEHIYVGNDGSTDRTSAIVKANGCQVTDQPNRGKSGALKATLEHFDLYNRYKYIVFVDADTRLREDYLQNALPLFDDPQIAAVAGYARSQWINNVFVAYRSRIWFTMQTFFRFGMSWKFTNVNMIIPGFASMYRTSALRQINIAKPGLVIEDFNMTFELQKKKLGKIAHHPNITGYTQDPHNFKTYCGQIRRWNLGFWQTIRANGVWPSAFWLNMSVYLMEMFFSGLLFLLLPGVITFTLSALILNFFSPALAAGVFPLALAGAQWLLTLLALDYLFTLITAIAQNKPELLFYGPTMLFFRWLDAYYFFAAFFLALKTTSNGDWVPPERWSVKKQEAKNLPAEEAKQKLETTEPIKLDSVVSGL